MLKPGGLLLLSTPNLTSWKGWYFFAVKGRLAPDPYDAFAKLDQLGHMGHVRSLLRRRGDVVSAKDGIYH